MLQIKVQRIHSGLTDIFKTNSGEWEKYIPDLRQNAEQLSQSKLNDESYIALILSEIGYYLGCFRSIKGRSGDSVVAWLFIPNDLEFKGIEIERRLNEINEEEEQVLNKICQDTFPKKEKDYVTPPTVDNASKRYAFRRYGKGTQYTLSEILDLLEQDYYTKFSAILLIESDDWIPSAVDGWQDLTSSPLTNKLHYRLPSIPEGYTLIFDQNRFENKDSKTVHIAEDIFTKDLKISREGYVDLQKTQFRLDDLANLDLQKEDWNKIITSDNFVVSSSNTEKDVRINYRITIEGATESTKGWIIPEKDYKEKQFTITVEAEGYDTYNKKTNLNQFNRVEIELKKKEKEHSFRIRSESSNQSIIFSLTGRQKFKTSPIKGYKINGEPDEDQNSVSYTLVYKPFAFMNGIVSKIFLIIAIAALIGLGYYLGNAYPLIAEQKGSSQMNKARTTGVISEDSSMNKQAANSKEVK